MKKKSIFFVFAFFLLIFDFPFFLHSFEVCSFENFHSALDFGGEIDISDNFAYSPGQNPDYLSANSYLTLDGGGQGIDGNYAGVNIRLYSDTEKHISGIYIFNSTSNFGGVFYNYSPSYAEIRNSSFTFNASSGSFTSSGGAAYNSGNIIIADSYFGNNRSVVSSVYLNGAYGGAFFNGSSGSAEIVNSSFDGNSSDFYGGAISNSGILYVADLSFTANSAGLYGGAIYNTGTAYIRGTAYFYGNVAASGKDIYNDGTLYFENSSPELSDGIEGGGSLIISSSVLNMGNAVLRQDSVDIQSGTLYVHSSSFSANTVNNNGEIHFSTLTAAHLNSDFSGTGTITVGSGSLAADRTMEQGILSITGENVSFINKSTVSAAIILGPGSKFSYDDADPASSAGGRLNLTGNSVNNGIISQKIVSLYENAHAENNGTINAYIMENNGTVSGGIINIYSSLSNNENSSLAGSTVSIAADAVMYAYNGSSFGKAINNGIINLNPGNSAIYTFSIVSESSGTLNIMGDMSDDSNISSKIAYVLGGISGQDIHVSSSVLKILGGSIEDSSIELANASSLDMNNGELGEIRLNSFSYSAGSALGIDASFMGNTAYGDMIYVSEEINGSGQLGLGSVNIISDDWMNMGSTSSFRLFSSSEANLANLKVSSITAAASFGKYSFKQNENDGGLIDIVKIGTGLNLEQSFADEYVNSYSMSEDEVFSLAPSFEGAYRNFTVHGNGYSIDGSSNSAVYVGITQSLRMEGMGEIAGFSTQSEELSGGFLVNDGFAYISSAAISGNFNALYGGGAIYNSDSAVLELEDVSFENNHSGGKDSDIYNNGMIYADKVSISGGIGGYGEIIFTAGNSSIGGVITQSTVSINSGATLASAAGGIKANAIINRGDLYLNNGSGQDESERVLSSAITGDGTLHFMNTVETTSEIRQGTVMVGTGLSLYAKGKIYAEIQNVGTVVYKAGEIPMQTSFAGNGTLRIQDNVINHGEIVQGRLAVDYGGSFESDASLLDFSEGVSNNGDILLSGGVNSNAISGTYGILRIVGNVDNDAAITQKGLENSGYIQSSENMTFGYVRNSGSISLSSGAVFRITDSYPYEYGEYSTVYDNNFTIGIGETLSLSGSSSFVKPLNTSSLSGGTLVMSDSSSLYAYNLNIGGGNAYARNNAVLRSSGTLNVSGGAAYLYNSSSMRSSGRIYVTGGLLSMSGNSFLNASNGVVISGGMLFAADGSPYANKVEITGGTLEIASRFHSSGNIGISKGGIVRTDIFSADSYGKLTSSGSISISADSVLSASVKNTFMSKGENIVLNLISASGGISGDFGKYSATPGYALYSAGNGSYRLVYNDSVYKEVKAAGGTDNDARAGDAWLHYLPEAGSVGENVKNILDTAYASSHKAYSDILTALSPESTPAVADISAGINSSVYDAMSSRLAGMEGLASGDAFSGIGTWGHVIYSKSSFDKGNGYNANTAGAVIGADSEIADGLMRVGAGYSYASTSLDSKFRETEIKTNTFFAYGQYVAELISYRGMLSVGKSDYSEKISAGELSGEVEYSGSSIGIEASAEYTPEYLDLGDYEWIKNFAPSAGIRMLSTERDAYSDTFSQKIGSESSTVIAAMLGLGWKKDYYYRSGNVFRPEIRAGLSFDIISPSKSVSVSLPDGSSYSIDIEKQGRTSFELSAYSGLVTENGIELGISYSGKIRQSQSIHSAMISAQYRF